MSCDSLPKFCDESFQMVLSCNGVLWQLKTNYIMPCRFLTCKNNNIKHGFSEPLICLAEMLKLKCNLYTRLSYMNSKY